MLFFILAGICGAVFTKFGLITSKATDLSVKLRLESDLAGVLAEVQQALGLTDSLEVISQEIDSILNSDEKTWDIPSRFLVSEIRVILDAANSLLYSNFLAGYSARFGLLHIVISRDINFLKKETPYSNTIYAEPSYLYEASALIDIVNYYSWTNLGIVNDEELFSTYAAEYIKSNKAGDIKDQIIYKQGVVKASEIAQRLNSITKDSGARIMLVLAKNSLAAQVIRAADICDMNTLGYGWLLGSDAMTNIGEILKSSFGQVQYSEIAVVRSGVLGIVKKEDLSDPLDSYLGVITLVVQGLLNKESTADQLKKYILSNPSTPSLRFSMSFDSSGQRIMKYDIVNTQNYAVLKVGEWDPVTRVSFNTNQRIVWPGFTTEVPNDKQSFIMLGLLYPAHDNDGNELKLGTEMLRGFNLGISYANSKKTSSFSFRGVVADTYELASFSAGILNMLSTQNIVAYVGPHSLDLCKAYSYYESLYLDPKPFITPWASSALLSNYNNYPYLLQVIQPDGLQAVALTFFIQIQGWKELALVYTNDDYGLGLYKSFQANIGTLEVEILNDEAYQIINMNNSYSNHISQTTKDSIDEVLSEIVRKQLKIVIYLGNPILVYDIARTAYDKELYGSEYAWIGTRWLTQEILNTINTTYNSSSSQILAVLNGAIGTDFRDPQGEVGQIFVDQYKAAYNTSYSAASALAFDAVLTYVEVISAMKSRGDNFNVGLYLSNSLRSADLTGATSRIKFSEGSNGRSPYGYLVVNLQGQSIVKVYDYDPLSPNLFIKFNSSDIVWGGGSPTSPVSKWPTAYDCPFAEHMSRPSAEGLVIIIAIGVTLFVATLILSHFSYKKWKQIEINPINEVVTRSWKDTLVQAQIAVEFFQFVAIAPNFSSLQIAIKTTSNIFMLDIMKIASTNKSDYWIMLSTVCGLCYFWSILVVIIMANGEHWLRKVPFFKRFISIMNTVFLPFYGNTFFLPALALLLDMFVCDYKAQGHAYVYRDCYTKCWDSNHTKYIIMSSLAIICYEPIAAYSRPLWQQSRTGLNLKIQPFFLLLKTCIQILLIVIGKSLQNISPLAHSVIFTVVMSLFTFYVFKNQPFNYNRCNLWEFSSLLAVSYFSFIATLSYSKDSQHVGWFVALAVGWLAILGLTIYVQKKKMPNLLIPAGAGRMKNKIYDIISLKAAKNEDQDDDKCHDDHENLKLDFSKEESRLEYDKEASRLEYDKEASRLEDDREVSRLEDDKEKLRQEKPDQSEDKAIGLVEVKVSSF